MEEGSTKRKLEASSSDQDHRKAAALGGSPLSSSASAMETEESGTHAVRFEKDTEGGEDATGDAASEGLTSAASASLPVGSRAADWDSRKYRTIASTKYAKARVVGSAADAAAASSVFVFAGGDVEGGAAEAGEIDKAAAAGAEDMS